MESLQLFILKQLKIILFKGKYLLLLLWYCGMLLVELAAGDTAAL
jgi:hypothetical protein